MKKENYIDYFPRIIDHIVSILDMETEEIKAGFSDYPVCITEFIENGITEKSVEIRFDKEKATVTCLFDNRGKCDFCLLFLNAMETEAMSDYLDYMNDNYKYNFVLNKWRVGDSYAQIQMNKKEISFNFLRCNKTRKEP